MVYEIQPVDSSRLSVFYVLQQHFGMPMGVAVPATFHGFTISIPLIACHVRYHIELWDYRSIGLP